MTDAVISSDLRDQAWAELADLIDRQLSPLGLAAMDVLAPTNGQTILDIGCGAGQTLSQLAERVGPTGKVIGVDLAPRVLAIAQHRTANLPQVSLLQTNAETLDLPDASLDGLYSRFGVMTFAYPIKAFANLRRMTKSGGRLSFICWQAVMRNEIDFVPLHAAGLGIEFDPAPYSFERPEIVSQTLSAAGFDAIMTTELKTAVSCGDADETLAVLTSVGPLGKILRERPQLAQEALPKVRAALPSPDTTGQIWMNAATWIVSATVP